MKTKLFTGLALAAVLLFGGPAFGSDNHRSGGGGRAAVARPAARSGHDVSNFAAVHRATSGARSTAFASRRTVNTSASRSYASSRDTGVAFRRNLAAASSHKTGTAYGKNFAASSSRSSGGGYRRNLSSNGGGGYARSGNSGHGQYAFASHNGWDPGRQYNWGGHRYGWYGNGWYIIDVGPYYGYGNYNNEGAQVQSALEQAGYYQGPIDGVIGPGTSAAIAAFQRDNGLRVTGTITHGLLRVLQIA